MALITPITDFSIINRIIEKSTITKEDGFLINSFVITPLVDYCGDIRPNEIDKVHEVEDESIRHFMNVIMSVFGRYNNSAFRQLLLTNPFSGFIQELKSSEYTNAEKDRAFIRGITKMVLANGNINMNIKAAGNMPQKMFSFRQSTADKWFELFVDTALVRIIFIYEKLGSDAASSSALALSAYQLYHSQPNRFDIGNCYNNDDAIS